MMIGFAAQDCEGAIELFYEEDSDELMGEGHEGQRNLLCSKRVDGGVKTVGASNDEYDAPGTGCHPFAKPFGKCHRATFGAVLVKQYYVVARLQLFLDEFCLLRFLLVGREGLGVAQLWNHLQAERHIVTQALRVVVDERLYVLVGGFTYDEEREFQIERLKD